MKEQSFVPTAPTVTLTRNYAGHNGPRTLVVHLYGEVTEERLRREQAIADHRAYQLTVTRKPAQPRFIFGDPALGEEE